MNTYQWSFIANELLKYNFKVKAFSTKLLQKNNFFLPANLAKICLTRKHKIYNGQTVILYPLNTSLSDAKKALEFLETTGLAIPLFAFANKRFLGVPLLKKIVNSAFEVNPLKIIVFLLSPTLSIIGTLRSINKQ